MQFWSAVSHELQRRAARSPLSVSSMRPTWLQWCLPSRLRAFHCSREQLQYSLRCCGRRSGGLVGDWERGRGLLFLFKLPFGRPRLRFVVGISSESGVGMPPKVPCVSGGSGEPLGVLGAASSCWSSSSGGSSSGDEFGTYIQDPKIPHQAIFLPFGGFLCPWQFPHTSVGIASSWSSGYEGYLTFGSLWKGFSPVPSPPPSPPPPPSPAPPDWLPGSLQWHIFGCFFFFLLLALTGSPTWAAGPATFR